MPVTPNVSRAQITITGPDFSPGTPEWATATPEQRRGYWREVAVLARDEVYRQLTKGIDANGEKMRARKRPRRDHATGPVLSPHWSDSRFRTELRWQGTPDGAVLWWRSPWGKIVGYHARGMVRGAPARNVVGITAQGQERIKAKAVQWWASQVRTGRMGVGVTMLGTLPMAAGAEGLVWRRSPPPRERGSIFGPVPTVPPPLVPPPQFSRIDRPWAVIQKLSAWWNAAGRGRVRDADIGRILDRMDRVLPLADLVEVVARFGVREVPTTKVRALELIGLNLRERLRSMQAPWIR